MGWAAASRATPGRTLARNGKQQTKEFFSLEIPSLIPTLALSAISIVKDAV
jgi:hypothetical protein